MPRVVVLGAGIGGVPMAFELREKLGRKAEIDVVSEFGMVPVRPIQSMGRRELAQARRREGPPAAGFRAPRDRLPRLWGEAGASGEKRSAAQRRAYATLRLSRHRDGPKLAFDEIEGLRAASQHALDLPHRRRCGRGDKLGGVLQGSRPHGGRRRSGRVLFGPAYEYALPRPPTCAAGKSGTACR